MDGVGTGRLRVPRYGRRSLADLVPAILAAHAGPGGRGGRGAPTAPAAPPAGSLAAELLDLRPRVVVLVVDGLGADVLSRHAVAAPVLAASPGRDVDAVFPSTTVSSLASIGTGRPPSRHGLVGYSWPVPDHHHPLNGLGWRIGLRGGGFDARAHVVPEACQPAPTAFERAAAAGTATTVVVDPDVLDSGLTRAALRGGQRVGARGLGATLDVALHHACAGDGRSLVYAHHPVVDRAGHVHGPDDDEVRDAVADVDRALGRLRPTLPPDVSVLVTADHGMVGVDDEDVLELADRPSLLDGVRVLAGEPRVRHLALEPGVAVGDVVTRWRDTLGDRASVLAREAALPLFGPDPTPQTIAAVGDVVVVSHRGTLVHERVDPHGGRMAGQHGGLTTAELRVPLRRLEAVA